MHIYIYIYTDTNLAVNYLSLTAKFVSVYIKEQKSLSQLTAIFVNCKISLC